MILIHYSLFDSKMFQAPFVIKDNSKHLFILFFLICINGAKKCFRPFSITKNERRNCLTSRLIVA